VWSNSSEPEGPQSTRPYGRLSENFIPRASKEPLAEPATILNFFVWRFFRHPKAPLLSPFSYGLVQRPNAVILNWPLGPRPDGP
jgi:hypothetical protein